MFYVICFSFFELIIELKIISSSLPPISRLFSGQLHVTPGTLSRYEPLLVHVACTNIVPQSGPLAAVYVRFFADTVVSVLLARMNDRSVVIVSAVRSPIGKICVKSGEKHEFRYI
jgi:hypothetical protein